jgi:hypothetical protein
MMTLSSWVAVEAVAKFLFGSQQAKTLFAPEALFPRLDE